MRPAAANGPTPLSVDSGFPENSDIGLSLKDSGSDCLLVARIRRCLFRKKTKSPRRRDRTATALRTTMTAISDEETLAVGALAPPADAWGLVEDTVADWEEETMDKDREGDEDADVDNVA